MMATYFHGGAEMQATTTTGGDTTTTTTTTNNNNNLQTLYLMNPNFISSASAGVAAAYSEPHHAQPPPNMLLLNPTATPNTLNQGNTSHHSPHQQLIGIPLTGPYSNDPNRPSSEHPHQMMNPAAMHGLGVSRVHYNLWSPTNEANPSQPGPINELGQMGFRRPVSTAQGGLSLSLSAGQHQQQNQNHHPDDMRMAVTVAGGPMTTNGVIMGSKYLKAAQELLEEVANVSGVANPINSGESSGVHKDKLKAAATDEDGGGESSRKAAAELTTAQRQELQMKKAKLLSMLDEVEQRYRQYHTQMQVVVSSFEQAAGFGSAKLYTSLALKTISKQFRCLKDAIGSQIKATSKSLGEDDTNGGGGGKLEGGPGSRLRFVDHQLRQQRALQQLGMMQHNAWRPQRGLPERAVSVLRAWLFEHFLHPYPKDSDKHLLAKQTGLTRSQVSNWFINARVRLWKPMVEEMYVEEMKGQEQNGGTTSEENTNTTNNNIIGSSSRNEDNSTPTNNNKTNYVPQLEQHQDGGNEIIIQNHHQQQQDNHQTTNDMISSLSAMSTTSSQGFTLIGSSADMESFMAGRSPKKQRSNNSDMNSPSSILSMDMEMKPLDQQQHHHHHIHNQLSRDSLHQRYHSSLMSGTGEATANQGGFNPYIVNDIAGRFNPDQLTQQYHGNAVALTLGLPHCESLSLSGSHHQHNFIANNQGIPLGRRLEIGSGDQSDFCGISMAQPSHPSNGYESLDIQNRKRFATHQILHDFVA